MRPVRLDVDGFASFRDPARVDFTDADYFALVGPTGSGKSTVVDAMTFALYGSAPRWGSISSIQYALAPTANRCTVRLIFDVAGRRYVVAREVRRSGSQISQRNCSLERYLDHTADGDPAADEATEILAEDPRGTRQQVSELLGLDFDDFCTCVVLPQGDFATFLKASAGERQNILLKLLGARHYDAIGKLAGRRAAEAGTRIDVLAGQLDELADATEEAETAARARDAELDALRPILAATVDSITAEAAQREAAQDRLTRAVDQQRLLESVAAPEGVGDLQQGMTRAQQGYRIASEQERLASAAASAAQQAVDSGPRRGPLELAQTMRGERADGRARLADIGEQARVAADDVTAAELAAHEAERRVGERRVACADAGAAATAASAALAELRGRISALVEVRVPVGVDDLAAAAGAARAAGEQAARLLTVLDAELAQARAAIDALPERSALDETGRTIDAYDAAAEQVELLGSRHDEVTRQLAASEARLVETAAAREAARDQWEQLGVEAAAAGLRPQLRVGDPCPVCDQPVVSLPPTLHAPLLDAARDSAAAAEREHAEATSDHQSLTTRLATAAAQLAGATERRAQLDGTLAQRLPGDDAGPARSTVADRNALAALTEELTAAVLRVGELSTRLEDTRRAADTAAADLRRTDTQAAQIGAELHATAGRLAAERPPALDPTDLAAAWAELSGWAAARGAELAGSDLPAAQRAADDDQTALADAARELTAATATDRSATEAHTAAALTAQRTALARDRLFDRLAELDRLLADQPDDGELRRLLTECDRLADEARAARIAAQATTDARQAAEEARDATRAEWEHARASFDEERERLVPLGAPRPDTADLANGWRELEAWSSREIEQRRRLSASLTADIERHDDRLRDHRRELAERLGTHGLDPVIPPDQAVPTIMVEAERARGRTAEVVRRRRESERLSARIARDRETRQVARELQQLMSSRRFPQWLADAALDTLVVDASASLMRLSNDQFDLTHERGDFFVIDHADADSRRSVRTLSGGETFQASLALALALSEQLSTLAAGGRTTLDSIFLDEGFGTLDPDALEIVAGTLENLAQDDRMVGVITHVSALAERVPVRFEVSRDSRTSSIVRVGP